MQRRAAATVAALAVVAALVVTAHPNDVASAAKPTPGVNGSYRYTTFTGGHRSASVAAIGTQPVKGTWSFGTRRGPVTCLVVDGNEAWLAGPGTSGPDTGVFIHVVDGGAPGPGNDLVTSWGQDPGQPFEELLGWCETKATHVPLFEMDSGNVTVKAQP